MHGKHEMEKVDKKAYDVSFKRAGQFFLIEDEIIEHRKHVVGKKR